MKIKSSTHFGRIWIKQNKKGKYLSGFLKMGALGVLEFFAEPNPWKSKEEDSDFILPKVIWKRPDEQYWEKDDA